jgi:hypothetical protein
MFMYNHSLRLLLYFIGFMASSMFLTNCIKAQNSITSFFAYPHQSVSVYSCLEDENEYLLEYNTIRDDTLFMKSANIQTRGSLEFGTLSLKLIFQKWQKGKVLKLDSSLIFCSDKIDTMTVVNEQVRKNGIMFIDPSVKNDVNILPNDSSVLNFHLGSLLVDSSLRNGYIHYRYYYSDPLDLYSNYYFTYRKGFGITEYRFMGQNNRVHFIFNFNRALN